ncbi:peptidase M16C associated-domain-containing protein [Halteromyces radiatus]|uniref:peptidase M16C associated-domain-containing protein n=1 Tax=Halteromyces radiatus TaxID=101107 RepID=UPI00221E5303|nr:peptidase M16C associated-domain-containing protein [Halteromyces radiatus]KAI8092588.1 peptidase M16C associated-domain-containing protein [Halteromyces radiatus]
MIQALLSTSSCYRSMHVAFRGTNTRSLLKTYTTKALSSGDQLHGYLVQQVQKVEELELTAILLEHQQTGAQHLHIDRNDANNVFAVGFHTPVKNSTGVAHVLEHTTLCGSHRYPVRDPFFKMLNRSLATYMNALTGSDYTVYPFATTNAVDYKNLEGVYMDAVFHPLLSELDYKQEGWRLEHDDLTDLSSPINFKGVVYNEMKGRISDPGYLFYKQSQQSMYPGTTYENASGGDPTFITDLTYQDLLDFHKTHYHPSNAKFYTYGNFSLEDHLATIRTKLNGFGKSEIPFVNKIPDRWAKPRKVVSNCALDPMVPVDRQTRLSYSFLTNDIHDSFETFSMRVLSTLLLEGHSSPMYEALIDSHLGTSFSSNTGYNRNTRISNLTIGLQGVKTQDVDQVETRIKQVLEKARMDGFDSRRIEATLHQMELGSKHKTSKFGLTIMHWITSGWFNGADPIDLLHINKYIARLRQELQKGPYFESLIDKYLLRNTHVLTYIMHPDASFNTVTANEEKDRLARKIQQEEKQQQQQLMEQAQQLEKKQNIIDDVSCLPTLRIDDIPLKQPKIVVEHTGLCNTPIQWRTTSTNGITYFRAICTLPPLMDDLKQYVPLFCDALHSLGTKSQSMAELDDEIRLYTGGLGFSATTSTNHSDINAMEEGIMFYGNCLDRNIEKMYDLTRRLIRETNFDNIPKLRSLIRRNASYLNNSIVNSGHMYAKTYASATLTPSSASNELLSGITQIKFMNQLAAKSDDDLLDVIEHLKQIATLAIHQTSLRVAVTCGEEAINDNMKYLSGLITGLPENADIKFSKEIEHTTQFDPTFKKTFIGIPSQVDFSAKSLRGVPYTHIDSAKLQILCSLLTSRYLHREIREKNGAYGGGAIYGALTGLLTFYSYRDPKSNTTVETYNKAMDWVRRYTFTDQDLTEAKLSLFQQVDAPVNVSMEGMPQFISGLSDNMRQIRREQLLSVTQNDIKDVAEQYLNQAYGITILGDEKKSGKDLPSDWKIHIP